MWSKPRTNETILLISAYWDNNSSQIPEKLDLALQHARNKNHQFILCIDSNAHSTIWGSPHDNSRGHTFEEFMASYNIQLQNIGKNNTFQTIRDGRQISSIIDLTLTSEQHPSPIKNWRISNSFEGSDHRMIHFTIETQKEPKITTYNFNKCNWTEFRLEMEKPWPEQPIEWGSNEIDKEAELIHKRTIMALDKACPKTTVRTHIKIGWWSQELHKAKKQARVNQHKMN
jgi:hypothetical protein